MQPAPTLPAATSQPAAHFVYNSLNLLQAFIQEGDKGGALTFLSRFSRLLRQWLCHASKAAVQLGAEATLLENYLALERERFAAGFDYAVVLKVKNAETILVTPLCWHPVVERLLYRQLLRSGTRGLLRITFMLKDGEPVCVIHAGVAPPDGLPASFTLEQRICLKP